MPCRRRTMIVVVVLALLLAASSAFADATASSPSIHASTVCEFSVHPGSCHATLASFHPSERAECYGDFSVEQSLERAAWTDNFLEQPDHHFLEEHGMNETRSAGAIAGVIDDCRELADLNLHYLKEAKDELRLQMLDPSPLLAYRIKALITTVTTNQQTCYDALRDSSGSYANVTDAVGKGIRLYSATYELVVDALDGVVEGSDFGEQFEFGSELNDYSNPDQNSTDLRSVVVISELVVVAKDGSGNFTSINEAVAYAPVNTVAGGGHFAIYIKEGVYNESVFVDHKKKNLIMIGDDINKTVITGNRYSGLGNWTTYNCATFSDYFMAIGITFENTAGPENHQAVAVRNSANFSVFYRCSFVGYQDTLYAHTFNQFYRECDIYGTVDFIFGNTASVFQNCNIYARKGLPGQSNVITAQGRMNATQMTGIAIHQCSIRASPELEPHLNTTKTYLGRPWQPYSRTVYIQSSLGGLIDPAGWMEWDVSVKNNHELLYYGEYENHGEGANTTNRVKWPGYRVMSKEDAANFTLQNFAAGNDWLPQTTIPYVADLSQ